MFLLGLEVVFVTYFGIRGYEKILAKPSLPTPSVATHVQSDEIEVTLEQVSMADIVVINTGEVIPVDGIVVAGVAAIDQHALTGEFQPTEKTVGDSVLPLL